MFSMYGRTLVLYIIYVLHIRYTNTVQYIVYRYNDQKRSTRALEPHAIIDYSAFFSFLEGVCRQTVEAPALASNLFRWTVRRRSATNELDLLLRHTCAHIIIVIKSSASLGNNILMSWFRVDIMQLLEV